MHYVAKVPKTRQKRAKKRSLLVVNEYFEDVYRLNHQLVVLDEIYLVVLEYYQQKIKNMEKFQLKVEKSN